MPKIHDILGASTTVQTTSTATADVKTVTAPPNATACLLSARTTSCYLTFDGSTPTSNNGHVFQINQQPYYLPVGKTLSFCSTASTNSNLDTTWLFN